MLRVLVLTLLVGVAVACTPDSVYDDCVAEATCRDALWHPTRTQFERFILHLPLNCSATSPTLDLAARVRTTYSCPPGFYGDLDDGGTLLCLCPSGQSCGVPSNQNFILALLFALVLLGGALYLRPQRTISL
jgi:hypothetical protein